MNSSSNIIAALKSANEKAIQKPAEMIHASQAEISEWAPLLTSMDKTSSGGSSVEFILSAAKNSVAIKVLNASDLNLETLGQITRLSDAQVAKFPGLLNRFDPQAALNEDTVFAIAMRRKELIATVHAKRSDDNNGVRLLHIANLNSDGSERGLAVPLTAALIIGDAHWTGSIANGEAIARVLPDGSANLGSTKTMMRLGFYAAEYFTHPVTLRNPQKTARGSAEVDGADLKYILQRGDAAEIEARSIAALTGWTVRFGKSLAV